MIKYLFDVNSLVAQSYRLRLIITFATTKQRYKQLIRIEKMKGKSGMQNRENEGKI
jgi:hypothetical protein